MDERLRAQLNEAIRAIRAGDPARGRTLLLRLLEADERIEPAWLWLSEVVEAPADKVAALENALSLNPNNAAARTRLTDLRRTLGAAPEAIPPPTPPAPPAPAPIAEDRPDSTNARPAAPAPSAAYSSVDPDDDPLQCPYCGRLTAEMDTTCPHCRRSLLTSAGWSGRRYLYFLLIALGLDVQSSAIQGMLPLAVTILIPKTSEWQARLAGLGLDGLTDLPMAWLVVRFVILLAVLMVFLNDFDFAFSAGLAVMTLDLAAHGAGWWFGLAPNAIVIWNAVLSSVVWLICLLALLGRSAGRTRLYTQLDRTLHGAVEFYRRAREHQRQGQWALAALHLQKASTFRQAEITVFKELALVQAKLGRYAKALATVEAGAFRAPADPEFATLLAEVRAQAKRATGR